MKEEFKYYIKEEIKEVLEEITIDYLENIKQYNEKTLGYFDDTNFN